MTRWTGNLIGVLGMFATAIASAADPVAGTSPSSVSDPDRLVIDALKEVHNRGADLYNSGDSPGCFRLYQGALLTVRPFLAHRPAIQKVIDDGLAEVGKTEGVKIQAFRLHEVIEDVRAKLKNELKRKPPSKPDDPKKVTKEEPKSKPPVDTKPKEEPKPKDDSKSEGDRPRSLTEFKLEEGTLTGTVKLDDKPIPGGEVMIVSSDQTNPHLFTAAVNAEGSYTIEGPIPVGKYTVLVTPGLTKLQIPERYSTAKTSGLFVKVAKGANTFDLQLFSK